MQAIILAAGRGSRMGSTADDLPKCLLQVGGRPLIEHELQILADAGASPVLVVVGYGADLVRETIGSKAETILNPRYEKTNSLYSFWLARDWIKGSVLVLNCDLVFERELVEKLVRAGPDHLLYDSSSGDAGEQMKVKLQNGTVARLSKDLSVRESNGENVGVLYFSEGTARALLSRADELITAGRENAFFVEAVNAIAMEHPIRGIDVAGLPWTEIDSAYDLDRARHQVWPRIAEHSGVRLGRHRRRRRLGILLGAVVLCLLLGGTWYVASIFSVQNWETIGSTSGRRVSLTVKNMAHDWWLIRGQEVFSTKVQGPRKVQVDFRGLLAHASARHVPYVVEVKVDGELHDLHKFTSKHDPKASFPDGLVGDKDKVEFHLGDGEHTIQVKLAAGEVTGLLTRVKVLGEW